MVKVREAPVGEIRIRDAHSFLDVTHQGELVYEVDSRGPAGTRLRPRPRWATITLYELDAGGWLLHRVGWSRVYHWAQDGCTRGTGGPSGEAATVADLPDDALACEACSPPYPDELEDGEEIRFEFPNHSLDMCDSPAQVIDRLTEARRRGTRNSTRIVSAPVRELLTAVARRDPRFRMEEDGALSA